MGPLFTVSTEPLRMERMTEPGRLVSSGSLDIERRRLLARRMAFSLQHQGGGMSPSISQADRANINRAFSKGSPVPVEGMRDRAVSFPDQEPLNAEAYDTHREAGSRYITERGAFEMRVQRGDLTFVPPLVMTVITQYPEIHFEYTGGFLYVPPSADPNGSFLDKMG